MAATLNALGRHVVLVGFMGAGKSTLGPQLAERLGRPFVSVDEIIEGVAGRTVAELFDELGEASFRGLEEAATLDLMSVEEDLVVELGGGALGSEATREAVDQYAFALLLETSPDEAWERVEGSGRPLARTREDFDALFEERRPVYESVADGSARDLDGAVLAVAGVHVELGAIGRLGEIVPGEAVELVIDARVDQLHGERVRAGLGDRSAGSHAAGAKTVEHAERLWSALRLDRGGVLVAAGGGSTTDLAGFVAATFLRGIAWAPVPTTLVGQVDAAIGGKTGLDLEEGKNLVGAFHWPSRVVIDPELLETLPEAELANGRAEVVKTGLLAGEPLWKLELAEHVRRCAAFKSAVCLRDPLDRGERAQLNLGHTFAHALEASSDFALPHGHAVALGLLAALRLSGLPEQAQEVEELLRPAPARVDRDRAWAALARDKKRVDGRSRLVLLDAPGSPRLGVEVSERELRAALDLLIA